MKDVKNGVLIISSSLPAHRLGRQLDHSCPWVVQMPDLCFVQPSHGVPLPTDVKGPVVAIEIKVLYNCSVCTV